MMNESESCVVINSNTATSSIYLPEGLFITTRLNRVEIEVSIKSLSMKGANEKDRTFKITAQNSNSNIY